LAIRQQPSPNTFEFDQFTNQDLGDYNFTLNRHFKIKTLTNQNGNVICCYKPYPEQALWAGGEAWETRFILQKSLILFCFATIKRGLNSLRNFLCPVLIHPVTRGVLGFAAALGTSAFLAAPAQALLVYNTTLAPEVAGATGSGTATLTIDEIANLMTIQVDFQGLSGNTTVSHIHGPTAVPFTGIAGVMTTSPSFAGFPTGVTSGTYNNLLDLLATSTYRAVFITANGNTVQGARDAFLAALAGNKAYLNIHSSTFAGGEIRGFFVQQVPGPLPIFGVGAALAWSRRLRRRLAASAT
jgi:hypothetical protein